MDKEIGIYCPRILESQVSVLKAQMIVGLLGYQEKPLISLGDKDAVRVSLEGFTDSFNNSEIDSLMNEYAKDGSNLDGRGFFLKPLFGRGSKQYIHRKGYFYMDRDYGFALGVEQEDKESPLWLAIISFTTDNSYKGPTIVQLQSYTHETYFSAGKEGQEKALSFLQAYHWEFFLVSLVGTWAQDMRIPAIYIMAGENNWYVGNGILPLERAKMRYDVTARRLGFRKLPDGNYRLQLDYSCPESET